MIMYNKLKEEDKINLRDVWGDLGHKQPYALWAYRMCVKPSWVEEGKDYGLLPTSSGNKEYWVTVEQARDLGMMATTDVGAVLRAHYISSERALISNGVTLPQSTILENLQAIKEAKPKLYLVKN